MYEGYQKGEIVIIKFLDQHAPDPEADPGEEPGEEEEDCACGDDGDGAGWERHFCGSSKVDTMSMKCLILYISVCRGSVDKYMDLSV